MTPILTLPLSELRQTLSDSMQQCRSRTLAFVRPLDYKTFCTQAHPDFSPIGWHLGHIAYTEALWILQRCAGYSPFMPEYHRLFAQDGLPKHDRAKLPEIATVIEYLETVRSKVLNYLAIAPVDQQERLWKWLLQHECQHAETMSIVLALLNPSSSNLQSIPSEPSNSQRTVLIPAGSFTMGNPATEAQDNERPPHEIYLEDYWIDRNPVSCAEYRSFIQAGGYHDPQWWTADGWEWVTSNAIVQPLHWNENYPVSGVSWYEADAYARFVGKRLPTEAEWEKAARFHNLLGEVWQWTSTWFAGYPNFESYPYPGYSQTYFDQAHRVLKGGSWATFPWAMRNSFRNWYYPHVREIFSGFRCVSDGVRS